MFLGEMMVIKEKKKKREERIRNVEKEKRTKKNKVKEKINEVQNSVRYNLYCDCHLPVTVPAKSISYQPDKHLE